MGGSAGAFAGAGGAGGSAGAGGGGLGSGASCAKAFGATHAINEPVPKVKSKQVRAKAKGHH